MSGAPWGCAAGEGRPRSWKGRGANAERSGAEGDAGGSKVGGTKARQVSDQVDGWADGIDGLMTRWADESPVGGQRAACYPAEFEG